MRYWFFHNNKVDGPHAPEELRRLPGFSAESLVCPEGRPGTEMGDWQRAGTVAELLSEMTKGEGPAQAAPAPAPISVSQAAPAAEAQTSVKDLVALGDIQEKVERLDKVLTQMQKDFLDFKDNDMAALSHKLEAQAQNSEEARARLAALEGQTEKVQAILSKLGELESQLMRQNDAIEALRGAQGQPSSPAPASPMMSAAPSPESAAAQNLEVPVAAPSQASVESASAGLAQVASASESAPAPSGSFGWPSAKAGSTAAQEPAASEAAPTPSPAESEHAVPAFAEPGHAVPAFAPAEPEPAPQKAPPPLATEPQAPAKKKSRAGMAVGIGAGVLFLGAVALYLLGSVKTEAPQGPLDSVPPMAAAPAQPVAPVMDKAVSAPPVSSPNGAPAAAQPQPPDPSSQAIQAVRAFALPTGRGTIAETVEKGLDAAQVPQMWRAAKVNEDLYLVGFYPNAAGSATEAYEFQVSLKGGQVTPQDAQAQALFAPPAAEKPSRKKRKRTKARRGE